MLFAIGEWYEHFEQLEDTEVCHLLDLNRFGRSPDCSRCELVFNVVMRPSGLFQQPVKVRINGFRIALFRQQVERVG